MFSTNIYINKLLKSFDLILKHTIDNRDDTIILKLVDQLANALKDNHLYDTVTNYIRTNVLNNHLELTDKDAEQQLFCLNLLKCIISIKYNPSFESQVQELILGYLSEDFYSIDSTILCSLVDLITQIQELDEQIRLKIFNLDSVVHFLHPNNKSVYVRNSFKLLLIKHLHEPAMVKLVKSMPEPIKLHNLDIFHTSGLLLTNLESKWELIDLHSIKHYSYMLSYDVESEQVLCQIADNFELHGHYDLAQKFLIYTYESFKGSKDILLKKFFAPFKRRKSQLDPIFKYYIHNLKTFIKFNLINFNMSDHVSISDVFYLLKSLNLKLKFKKSILECLIDYFEMKKNLENYFLSALNEGIESIFMFKLDGELSIELLKLCALESTQIIEKVCFDKIDLGQLLIYVSLTRYMLKSMSVNGIDKLLKKCLSVLFESEDAEIKDLIMSLFIELNNYDILIFNDQIMEKILLLCLAESEAFLRREYLKFLTKFYSIQPNEIISEFFCYFLLYDHDWQCQLYCIDYFDQVFDNLIRQKSGHVIPICASLATGIDDADQHVVNACCKILTKLKLSNDFSNLLEKLEKPQSGLVNELKEKSKWLAVGCEESVLVYNLDKFNKVSLPMLEEKMSISSQSSDLYEMNATAILDDIISAYQFDWDDQKALDCY